MSAELQPGVLRRPRNRRESMPDLTERELQTVHLLGKGLANKEIAGELSISQRTVEIHVGRIYDKLGLRGRVTFGVWYAKHFPERCDIGDPNLQPDLVAALRSVVRARELLDSGSMELARSAIGGAEALLERHARVDR